MDLKFRMYKNKYPKPDEIVIAKIKNISQGIGTYVTLPEYADIEGFIMMSELSRKHFTNINRITQVNKYIVASVLRVDQEKGYIDLSKKVVSEEEIKLAEKKFNKSKIVHSIILSACSKLNCHPQNLYESLWEIDCPHIYDFFKDVLSNKKQLTFSDEINKVLLEEIKSKIIIKEFVINTFFEMFSGQGFDIIINIYKKLKQKYPNIVVCNIMIPLYYIEYTTTNYTKGCEYLNNYLKDLQNELKMVNTTSFKLVKGPCEKLNDQEKNQLLNSISGLKRKDHLM
jgi:translation initiation factor 2 subunit 1